MNNIRTVTLNRWTVGEKSGRWSTLPELSDDDLLVYARATEAQIKLRERALADAQNEIKKRGLKTDAR